MLVARLEFLDLGNCELSHFGPNSKAAHLLSWGVLFSYVLLHNVFYGSGGALSRQPC